MNAHDVLKYGHLWVHKHVEDLTEGQWQHPNVCGIWSTKDIIAHLGSFEWVLVDVLSSIVGAVQTPLLDQYIELHGDDFNAQEVSKRKDLLPAKVLLDYNEGYQHVQELLPYIGEGTLRRPGIIPWYGKEYSLEDLIVYQYYGHKREHCAQIAIYRDTLR